MSGEAEDGRVDPAKDAFVGTVVNGRFHIVKRVARGGMASVYFATQDPLNRPVAIKVVRCVDPESEQDFRQRFLREASILAQLQHPNIVTLLDYGPISDQSEEHYFMAMEYLRGETLAKRFKRVGRLTIEESLALARQIGRGLREAHRRGFIHRDLKPTNIMLVPEDDKNDIVKLVDFGVGKILTTRMGTSVTGASREEDTRVGMLLGSPRYMAPEQIRCEPVELRTDLYGLGVILFQALTGVLPFDSQSEFELLTAHCSKPPPRLEDVCPDQFFPASLSALILALLAKQPRDRPTIEEFLERLAGIEEEMFGIVGLAGPTLAGTNGIPSPISLAALRTPSRPIRIGRRPADAEALDSTPVHRSWPKPVVQPDPEEQGTTPILGAGLLASRMSRRKSRRELVITGVLLGLGVTVISALAWLGFRDPHPAGPVAASVPIEKVQRPVVPIVAPSVAKSVPTEPVSFSLSIESLPKDALVTERDEIVGRTPLVVTIARDSVASAARLFLVKADGYVPFVLEQGDSKVPVHAFANLRPVAVAGGPSLQHSEAKRGGGVAKRRPGSASARRKPALSARTLAESDHDPAAPARDIVPAAKRSKSTSLDIRTHR